MLLGQNFLEKNVLIGAAPVITHGVAGATTLGTANILMVTSNLLEILSGNPVSNQAVMDAAARYVRSHPDSEESGDAYQVLGKAYESRGHLHQALYYYRLSGELSAEQIRELEERAGRTLLKAAEESDSKARQRTLYAAILQHYPDTPAGEKAKGLLARLVSLKNRGLQLSKQFLAENPELYGPRGLGLKTALFDGRTDNMELADPGLNILGRDAMLLHYDTPWGIRTRTYPVAKQRMEGLETLLREKHYELAMQDVDERDGNSVGGLKDFPARLMQFEPAERRPGDADLEFIRRTGRGAESGLPDTRPRAAEREGNRSPAGLRPARHAGQRHRFGSQRARGRAGVVPGRRAGGGQRRRRRLCRSPPADTVAQGLHPGGLHATRPRRAAVPHAPDPQAEDVGRGRAPVPVARHAVSASLILSETTRTRAPPRRSVSS